MSNSQISVIGFPLDENSSFLRGPAKAPDVIRKIFDSYSINLCAENGVELRNNPCWNDVGNVDLTTGADAMNQIENSIRGLLNSGIKPISLGGDHSITFPIIKAFAEKYEKLNIFHIDAHPDLYDNFEDNPFSHASPFARIMENDLVNKLLQVGIRTINPTQQRQIDKFNVEAHDMINFDSSMKFEFDGPVYISIDLDGLDPAFAPGVSHHEPGGLSTRQALQMIQSLDYEIVGADIVEYNPDRDINDMTAMVCVKFLKELLAKMS
ncbi:MAG TPA: agmatinase [Candidatus Marinimicrobia bacterium]|nr:agmatinase [Candidatus Neomarinimicrobiota bacterium]